MSRMMVHGVLGMPRDIWGDNDSVDAIQRHEFYKRASKIIESQDEALEQVKKDFAEILAICEANGLSSDRIKELAEKERSTED